MKAADNRALGKLISRVEDRDPTIWAELAQQFPTVGNSKRIGITGPPGAGKSTLISHFIRNIRARALRVAVVAVDPVSPFTGGAILGDRIRLLDHFNDPGVFIRSLSTRGKLGGLSLATKQVVHLLDANGFDYILIESVGVGQSEVDIRTIADLSAVVLVPEWGDSVQALKAGLLEIADIFVVNKSDREGADRIATELTSMLQLTNRQDTPVVLTTSKKSETIDELQKVMDTYLEKNAKATAERRSKWQREMLRELIEESVQPEIQNWIKAQAASSTNPYESLLKFREKNPGGKVFK